MTKDDITNPNAKIIFSLLRAFSRGLSHKIRTPLSVISNELSYLALENKDILSQKRCQEIASILSQIQLPNSDDLKTYPLNDFLEKISFSFVAPDQEITASPNLFNFALKQIKNLLPEAQFKISATASELNLQIKTPHEAKIINQTFSSFTSYFCEALNWAEYMPILIDTALMLQSIIIEIQTPNTKVNGILTISLKASLL